MGTAINVVLTVCAAFALSQKTLPGRNLFTFLFTFTMLFSGGIIPTYLQLRSLGIINTRWALLLPGAVSVYNMVVTRTFIGNIPAELSEAAQIDGCSDARYFVSILLPLSKAIIAVISLYYAVGHWNAYFNALLYLSDRTLYPLQVFLRDILVLNAVEVSSTMDPEEARALEGMRDLLKYSMIVVSTVPILCVYPAIQKYFAKGVMVGSLKGRTIRFKNLYSPHVADASRQSCRGAFFSAAVRGSATDLTERARSGTMTMELYTVFRGARV